MSLINVVSSDAVLAKLEEVNERVADLEIAALFSGCCDARVAGAHDRVVERARTRLQAAQNSKGGRSDGGLGAAAVVDTTHPAGGTDAPAVAASGETGEVLGDAVSPTGAAESATARLPFDCNADHVIVFRGQDLQWCSDCGAIGEQAFSGGMWRWRFPCFSQNLLEQHERTQREIVAARQQMERAAEILMLPAGEMVALAVEAYNLFLPLMDTIPAAREWVAKFQALASATLLRHLDEEKPS